MSRQGPGAERGVVVILADGEPVGVGFVASPSGIVVTSRETLARVGDRSRCSARFGDTRSAAVPLGADSSSRDADFDVAALETEGVNAEPLPLGFERVPPVSRIVLFGLSPDGSGIVSLTGDYVSTEPVPSARGAFYRMRLHVDGISETFSGSPVWDSVSRRVIGVVGRVDAAGGAQAVPVARVVAELPGLAFASECPYPGIAPFGEADAHLYFGRTQVVEELLDRLRASSRWITVIGPAGIGKSSLLRAGLLPRLRKGEVESLPNPVVVDALAMTSFQAIERPPESALIALVDPLEDALEALAGDDPPRDWLQRLDILANEPRTVVLMSVTSAFLPVVAALSPDTANSRIFPSAFQMPVAIREADAREMIETPLKQPGFECLFPRELIATLLDSLHETEVPFGAERAINASQLPLLQLTLRQMWRLQNRRGAYAMSAGDYAVVGHVQDALNRWADDIFRGIDPLDEEIARRILADDLTFRDATGRQPPRGRWRYAVELPRSEEERSAVERVVLALLNEGLLRREGVGESTRVRLAHDSLLTQWDQLRTWLENAEYSQWLRRVRRTSVAEPLWRRAFRAIRAPLVRAFRRAFERRYPTTGSAPVERSQRAAWRLVVGSLAVVFAVVTVSFIARGLRPKDAPAASRAVQRALEAGVGRLVRRDPQGLLDLANAYLDAAGDERLQRALASVWSAWRSQWDDGSVAAISAPPSAVVISPNGNLIATTSGDLGVWRLDTGQRVAETTGVLAVSADRMRLAVGAERGVRLLDFQTGESAGNEMTLSGPPSRIVFSADGNRVAASSANRFVVWETRTGRILATVENDAPLRAIGFAGSGDWFAAISGANPPGETNTDLYVWNLVGKPARRSLNKADDFVVSPSGRYIAAVKNRRSTVEVFDTTTLLLSLDRVAEVRTNRVDSARFSPDETMLLTRSYNSERVWDRATGERIGDRVRTVLFPANGARSLVLYENGALSLRARSDTLQTTETPIVSSSGEAFTRASLATDSNWAVVSSDNAVAFVNLQTGAMTATIQAHSGGDVREGVGYVTDGVVTRRVDPKTGEPLPGEVSGALVVVGSDGRLVTATGDLSLGIWAKNPKGALPGQTAIRVSAGTTPISLAPDGKTGLALTGANVIAAFDARSGTPLGASYRLASSRRELRVVYSADGRFAAFGMDDYALVDLRENRIVSAGACWNGAFAFDSDGATFAVAREAKTLEIRSLGTPDRVRTVALPPALPSDASARFSSDLTQIAYATTNGGAVSVADIENEGTERSFVLRGKVAGSVVFDGEGARVAVPYATDEGAFVDAIEMRSGHVTTFALAVGVSRVVATAFDDDGRRIVASAVFADGTSRTRCWRTSDGEPVWSSPVGGAAIRFAADGSKIAVGAFVLDALSGVPYPLPRRGFAANLLEAPVAAFPDDETCVAIGSAGVVTFAFPRSEPTATEIQERTAIVTGVFPSGASATPEPLDAKSLSELKRRLETPK